MVANGLSTGLLRPIAGLIGGVPAAATVTVAGRSGQVATMAQQAYWSAKGQKTLRALIAADEPGFRALARRAITLNLILMLLYALAAPAALFIFSVGPPTRTC